ncbi:hypothetical protein KEM54_005940 [Ascosphaera aggregata]|nr:hypothetical protein KEM54_005940 [Ascosphaera aggregata]
MERIAPSIQAIGGGSGTPSRRPIMPPIKHRRSRKRWCYNLSITDRTSVIIARRRIRRVYRRKPEHLSRIPWFSPQPQRTSHGPLSRLLKLPTFLLPLKPYFQNVAIVGGTVIALEVLTKIIWLQQFISNALTFDRTETNPFKLWNKKAPGEQGDVPGLQVDLSIMLFLAQRYMQIGQQSANSPVEAVAATRGVPLPICCAMIYALVASTWSRASEEEFEKPFREFFIRLVLVYLDGVGASSIIRLTKGERRLRRKALREKRYLAEEMKTSALRLRRWNYFMTSRDLRAASMKRTRRRWTAKLLRRLWSENDAWSCQGDILSSGGCEEQEEVKNREDQEQAKEEVIGDEEGLEEEEEREHEEKGELIEEEGEEAKEEERESVEEEEQEVQEERLDEARDVEEQEKKGKAERNEETEEEAEKKEKTGEEEEIIEEIGEKAKTKEDDSMPGDN